LPQPIAVFQFPNVPYLQCMDFSSKIQLVDLLKRFAHDVNHSHIRLSIGEGFSFSILVAADGDEERILSCYYDPRMARFLSVDPLAGEFPSWTSYHYVHNNPLRYTDPTGMRAESPIFGFDGEFLGVDSEGYGGDIVIMDSDKYKDLTNNGQKTLDHNQVMKWAESSPHASKLNDSNISVESYSKLLTHVTKQLSGEKFDGTSLDFSRLENGMIHIRNEVPDMETGGVLREPYGNPTNPYSQIAGALVRSSGDINVTAILMNGKNDIFGKVENIQSFLGIHEYYGHGVKGLSMNPKDHSRVYQLQRGHRTYQNTSQGVKSLIEEGL